MLEPGVLSQELTVAAFAHTRRASDYDVGLTSSHVEIRRKFIEYDDNVEIKYMSLRIAR